MSKTKNNYSESFKLQVLSDYYANGSPFRATCKKWNVTQGSLGRWIKASCTNEKKVVSLQPETKNDPLMQDNQSTIQELQQQVANLQKSLEFERLRVTAYERLIEIVKKEDGIDLLKKGGAKQ
ncbi:MAG: transposase [archaeon]|nr:transposase [archaeon]